MNLSTLGCVVFVVHTYFKLLLSTPVMSSLTSTSTPSKFPVAVFGEKLTVGAFVSSTGTRLFNWYGFSYVPSPPLISTSGLRLMTGRIPCLLVTSTLVNAPLLFTINCDT